MIVDSVGETMTALSGCSELIKGRRRAATLTLAAMDATRAELRFELHRVVSRDQDMATDNAYVQLTIPHQSHTVCTTQII